jgi:UDP-2,3-diacylglucosamine pyrophosphatase LpxH
MDDQHEKDAPTRHRALFISDVHLGSKPAKAEFLVDFLRRNEADTIYLVGDIIDGWRLKRSWHWPQSHNDVVQKLLRQARKGTRVVYVAGNHDEFLRGFQGVHFGGVVVVDTVIHEAADGRRYLVLHGDQFDSVVHSARWLAHLGDFAYDASIVVNRIVARGRRMLGLPYWSFSAWAKVRVKQAVSFIGTFQRLVADEALKHGVDGVICGHIHHAAIEDVDGVAYMNSGDWVESCTALAEDHEGGFRILNWAQNLQAAPRRAERLVPIALPQPEVEAEAA